MHTNSITNNAFKNVYLELNCVQWSNPRFEEKGLGSRKIRNKNN